MSTHKFKTWQELLNHLLEANNKHLVHHYLGTGCYPIICYDLVHGLILNDLLDVDEPSDSYNRFMESDETELTFREDCKRSYAYYENEEEKQILELIESISKKQ
jgi:hypothetical protein